MIEVVREGVHYFFDDANFAKMMQTERGDGRSVYAHTLREFSEVVVEGNKLVKCRLSLDEVFRFYLNKTSHNQFAGRRLEV